MSLLSFGFLEVAYNMNISTLLTFLGIAVSIPFGAKGLDLMIFVSMIINVLLTSGFYYWGWDWTFPFKLILLGVVFLALNLYTKTSGDTVI